MTYMFLSVCWNSQNNRFCVASLAFLWICSIFRIVITLKPSKIYQIMVYFIACYLLWHIHRFLANFKGKGMFVILSIPLLSECHLQLLHINQQNEILWITNSLLSILNNFIRVHCLKCQTYRMWHSILSTHECQTLLATDVWHNVLLTFCVMNISECDRFIVNLIFEKRILATISWHNWQEATTRATTMPFDYDFFNIYFTLIQDLLWMKSWNLQLAGL